MSNYRYTSLVGYERSVLDGLASEVKKDVMRALFEAQTPMTRHMLEIATRRRINTITPAVFTLIRSGLIRITHVAEDPHTGYQAEFLEPVYPQPVQRTFEGLFGNMGQTVLATGTWAS